MRCQSSIGGMAGPEIEILAGVSQEVFEVSVVVCSKRLHGIRKVVHFLDCVASFGARLHMLWHSGSLFLRGFSSFKNLLKILINFSCPLHWPDNRTDVKRSSNLKRRARPNRLPVLSFLHPVRIVRGLHGFHVLHLITEGKP